MKVIGLTAWAPVVAHLRDHYLVTSVLLLRRSGVDIPCEHSQLSPQPLLDGLLSGQIALELADASAEPFGGELSLELLHAGTEARFAVCIIAVVGRAMVAAVPMVGAMVMMVVRGVALLAVVGGYRAQAILVGGDSREQGAVVPPSNGAVAVFGQEVEES